MDKEPTHIKIVIALIALVGMLGAAAIPTFFGRQAPGGTTHASTADGVGDNRREAPAARPRPEPDREREAEVEPEPEVVPKPKSTPTPRPKSMPEPTATMVTRRLEPEIPDISGAWRG